MLAKRIVPCLDVDDGKVMKGIRFQELTEVGDPVELAAMYNEQGADELVFLDIGASPNNRATLLEVVEQVSRKVFIPLTVGGGIRTVDDIREALSKGADKVSLNTAAVKDPELVKEAAAAFGSQCIVIAIDARRMGDSWQVRVNGGRTPTDRDAVEWAREVEDKGAGEILLTSWDADGTLEGFDLDLTNTISDAVSIPIIASGGAGTPDDILDVLTDGNADAALMASILHYGTYEVRDIKEYLSENGVVVR
jgi:cyclase